MVEKLNYTHLLAFGVEDGEEEMPIKESDQEEDDDTDDEEDDLEDEEDDLKDGAEEDLES
jgi:hypothetical protein